MSLPYVTLVLPLGTSILIQLEDADGQFVISYGDPGATPQDMDVEAVRVMADLPDSSGREGIVYEELFGSPPEETLTEPAQETQSPEPAAEAYTPPASSLDQLLAGAIARDPETGALPTEPAPEAVQLSESKGATPAATTATAQGNAVETASQASGPAFEALPANAKGMDANPPRDGTPVVLYQYEANGDLARVEAKWSFAIGRQFWIDAEDEETLGFDADFVAWSPTT